MKTLIIYETRFGSVEKCINILKKHLKGEVHTLKLSNRNNINLDDYDQIIIGGSVYFDKIHIDLKYFCKEALKTLLKKRIGLFVCSLRDYDNKKMKKFFPRKLVKHSLIKESFGGELNIKKLHEKEKFILKRLIKIDDKIPKINIDTEEHFSNINTEKIKNFAEILNKN